MKTISFLLVLLLLIASIFSFVTVDMNKIEKDIIVTNNYVGEFVVYDPHQQNSVLYNPGDIVLYNSEYYLCKQQIFNHNGLPPSLPQYWEITEYEEEPEEPEETNTNIMITGLIFEDVDAYWTSTGVTLTNSYTDISLTAKQVFVPDDLSDLTEHFTYYLQEWYGNQARFWVTLTYLPSYCGWAGNPQIYPHKNLDTLLGNSEWTGSPYPANRFQISNKEVWATESTEDGYVCDITDFEDETVEWVITVTSYYYRILINYDLMYGDDLVYTFTDVYFGDEPDLLIVDYQINKYRDPQLDTIVDRSLIRYDNLYGENKTINVTIAYPSGKSILETSNNLFPLEDDLYSVVNTTAHNLNRTETLLESLENYTLKSFTASVEEDSINIYYFKVQSKYDEFNDLRIWLTGSYAGGAGTSANPYQISNWTHLNSVKSNLTESFILNNDLNWTITGYDTYASSTANAGAGWSTIGTGTNKFAGTFDGQNYTISDLYISRSGTNYIGLFGYLDSTGIVRNLNLYNATITGKDSTGGLIGSNYGTVDNCSVRESSIIGALFVGGFSGNIEGATRNSYAICDVNGTGYVGGFCGSMSGIISNCYSTGTTSRKSGASIEIGGFIGLNFQGSISYCYSTNRIYYTDASDPTSKGFAGSVITGGGYHMSNNFWDTQVSGQTTTSGTATGKTTSQMKTISTFSDSSYDIATTGLYANETWWISNTIEYPRLRMENTITFNSLSVNPSYGYTTTHINSSISVVGTSVVSVRWILMSGSTVSSNQSAVHSSGTGYFYNDTINISSLYTVEFRVYDGTYWYRSLSSSVTVYPSPSFQFSYPVFLEVGDYIHGYGSIKVGSSPLTSTWVTTRVLNSTGSTVPFSMMELYVVNGLYIYVFSTSTMLPGIYTIQANYTNGSTNFIYNSTLYLSDYSGPGYVLTNAYFMFYDANKGTGLLPELFKIYTDNSVPLASGDRIYGNMYTNTYVGETLYYRIDDYFNNKIYPTDGSYSTVVVESGNFIIDVPITWNSFSVKNMNSSIVHFSISSGATTYSQYLFPYEPFYLNVLPGTYDVNLTFYDPITDAIEDYRNESISVSSDTYYWVQGYDLRDIIIEIIAVNTSIDTLSIDISAGVTLTDSSVNNISIRMLANITATETNITNLILNQNSNITLINTIVDNINTTMRSDITFINATIDTINSKININFEMLQTNVTHMNNTITTRINTINSTINTQTNTITTQIVSQNSNITTMRNSLYNTITILESNITSLSNDIWNSINISNTMLNYMNNSIYNRIASINTTIQTMTNTITTQIVLQNLNLTNMRNNIYTAITLSESNITSLSNLLWNTINITDSIATYINNTIWGEFNTINLTLNSINNTMIGQFSIINSSIQNVSISIEGNVTINDTVITNMLANIQSNMTITDSYISYMNTTMWGSFAITNSYVNNTKLTLYGMWNDQNNSFQDLENLSTVIFNFYNTNFGLGLPRETLQVYVNGTRLTDNIYYCTNATDVINVTIKDYYNVTLFHQNFTINTRYRFLDLGLTFHSWLFGNKNEEYYMISLLREGASRWWERGIVPYGEREFMIPSGNYTLRIYDGDYNELYNQTHTINRSMVYVIEGSNLSQVIAGLSVIRGQLLELSGNFRPDIVKIGSNLPYVYSIYDVEGCTNTLNITKICPAQVLIATTERTYERNRTITRFVPGNDTTNGTIYILDDYLQFEGGTVSWVNVSFTSNGTRIQNTTYLPNRLDLNRYGNGISVNVYASHPITIKRITRYQQVQEFYWTKYLDQDMYQATINFDNPLNDTIWKVYMIAYFATDKEPDYSRISVYDVTNTVMLSEDDGRYDCTARGVQFMVDFIPAGGTRSFRVTYYGKAENIQPSDAIVSISIYDRTTTHKDKNYYYMEAQWTNTRSDTFIGPIHLKFNFNTLPRVISPSTIEIWDNINLRYLDNDEFTYTGSSIIISQEAVGTVLPQTTRSYKIYYLFSVEESGSADVKDFISSSFAGPILWIHLLSTFVIFIGVASVLASKKEKKLKDKLYIFWLCLLILFFLNMYYLL